MALVVATPELSIIGFIIILAFAPGLAPDRMLGGLFMLLTAVFSFIASKSSFMEIIRGSVPVLADIINIFVNLSFLWFGVGLFLIVFGARQMVNWKATMIQVGIITVCYILFNLVK